MDDIERIGGEFSRQASQQRHELNVASRRLRQLRHHGGKRAAVTDADDLVVATLQHLTQEARALQGKRLQRQISLAEIRCDAAEGQPVTFGERVFKRHAFGDRPLDEDADHAFAAGPRNQTMRLGALDVETIGDFGLRQPGGEIEPRRAGGERSLAIHHRNSIGSCRHAGMPTCKFLHTLQKIADVDPAVNPPNVLQRNGS